MRWITLCCLLAFSTRVNGQQAGSSWTHPYCYDSLGVLQSREGVEQMIYVVPAQQVKRFPKRNRVSIHIEEYMIGTERYTCSASYSGRIRGETPIISIGNGRGVQLGLGRAEIGGNKVYLYQLKMWEYSASETCWKPLAYYNTMNVLDSMEHSLSGFSVGYSGTPDYMELLKGGFEVR